MDRMGQRAGHLTRPIRPAQRVLNSMRILGGGDVLSASET